MNGLGKERGVRRLLLLMAGAAVLLPPLWAQFGKVGAVSGFKLPVFFDQPKAGRTNQIRALITGSRATPQPNGLILLEQMRIDDYLEDGRTNLVAKAPQCILDPYKRVAGSPGWLEVEAGQGQLHLEGEGFFCRMTNASLIVSNRVRTLIRKDALPSNP